MRWKQFSKPLDKPHICYFIIVMKLDTSGFLPTPKPNPVSWSEGLKHKGLSMSIPSGGLQLSPH